MHARKCPCTASFPAKSVPHRCTLFGHASCRVSSVAGPFHSVGDSTRRGACTSNMASRGGRGGGRGGRGGASGKPQPPMGHLQYAEIIEQSKQGTDVLYPVRAQALCARLAQVKDLHHADPCATGWSYDAASSLWNCPRRNIPRNEKRGSPSVTTRWSTR